MTVTAEATWINSGVKFICRERKGKGGRPRSAHDDQKTRQTMKVFSKTCQFGLMAQSGYPTAFIFYTNLVKLDEYKLDQER